MAREEAANAVLSTVLPREVDGRTDMSKVDGMAS